MNYQIGCSFKNAYPPEAAVWCNNNNAVMELENNIFIIKSAKSATEQETAENLRSKRNLLLKESDKYMLPDYPITAEKRNLYKIYRQKLRSLTDQDRFPHNVNFPDIP